MIEDILKKLNCGLEIGGPSGNFYHTIPIYKFIKKLDGFNMFDNNNWQKIFSSEYKLPQEWDVSNKVLGKQYNYDISENIEHDKKYDFILTNHVIEHFANPLKCIFNMKKLLKDESYIITVLPHYKYIFDRKRKLTKFDHIVQDYLYDIGEDDKTHISDFIDNFDTTYSDIGTIVEDSKMNFKKRTVHYHTYNDVTSKMLFEYCGFENLYSNIDKHGNIIILSKNKI